MSLDSNSEDEIMGLFSRFTKLDKEHEDIQKRLEEEEQKTQELARRLKLLEIEVSTFKVHKVKR